MIGRKCPARKTCVSLPDAYQSLSWSAAPFEIFGNVRYYDIVVVASHALTLRVIEQMQIVLQSGHHLVSHNLAVGLGHICQSLHHRRHYHATQSISAIGCLLLLSLGLPGLI